jgi:hypothetical protein
VDALELVEGVGGVEAGEVDVVYGRAEERD